MANSKAHYTGAQVLIEALIEQGVDIIFGYPGGAVLNIYDELYRQRGRIKHILVSHEQHAAHAADGYARATGKTGVCLATSGPGATNLVTGIATAYMDSVPIVAVTGNVSCELLGKDSFQEVDITGITMPIVKHNWIVKDVRELAETVREAFIVARTGRPGPVLIDITKDVTAAKTGFSSSLVTPSGIMSERALRLTERNTRKTFSAEDIKNAAALLCAAKSPVIYAGGGVIIANAAEALTRFAERLNAPVALSLMAQGALSREHPLWTGMIGMHGTAASNKAVQNGDLLITIGARFSDRVTSRADQFARNAKILHFDIDPAEINKNVRSEAFVTGDINMILERVLDLLPQQAHEGWMSQISNWKTQLGGSLPPRSEADASTLPPSLNRNRAQSARLPSCGAAATKTPPSNSQNPSPYTLSPKTIIEEAAQAIGRDSIVVTDVGQHQMWASQFFPFNFPRQFITSGGLGTMGFGLGAALGAKAARPQKNVILFTGDGSFRMNCAELATLAALKMPVLVIIFNNGVLGMVRQWQNLFYEKRYSETVLERPPDFVKLASAYGCSGYRCEDGAELTAALESAKKDMAAGVPVILDVIIDKDAMVLPMVPGGKPIDEQIVCLSTR